MKHTLKTIFTKRDENGTNAPTSQSNLSKININLKNYFQMKTLIHFHAAVLLLILPPACFSQAQFCVTVGGAGSDEGLSIVQTSDGGYAVAGYTASFGQGLNDVYVMKLDGSGTVQWTRTIGSSINDYGFSIIQTTDGGYAVAGYYNWQFFPVISPELYVIKLDGSGAVQWTRTVGGANVEYGRSIIQTSDGGYAVAGYTGSYGVGGKELYVVKLDGSGTLQWTRTVGRIDGDDGYSIVQTSDGGLAVAGYGQGGPFFYSLYVVKLDASGTLQWTRTISIGVSDYGFSIVQTSDGGLAVTGIASNDLYVVKLDGSGILLWTRTVGGASYEYGQSIVQTSDGGLAVAGYTNSYGAGGNDVYVVKLDGSGTVLWTKTFGGTGMDRGYSIVQTSDGGFAVAGTTNSFGSGSNDVYIVKLDANGDGCCSASSGGISGSGGNSGSGGTSGSGGVSGSGGASGSGGTLTDVCVPQPVELLYFTATAESHAASVVRCEWATASELNNDYFAVERAAPLPPEGGSNVGDFVQIGTVKGAGNSSTTLHYEFVDTLPPLGGGGALYYRLKQVDFNGTFTYSEIRTVYIGTISIISIFPNPSSDYIQYTVGSETGGVVTVRLYDAMGREVLYKEETIEKGVTEKKIETSRFGGTSGNYLLRITNGNLEKTQKQFVIK